MRSSLAGRRPAGALAIVAGAAGMLAFGLGASGCQERRYEFGPQLGTDAAAGVDGPEGEDAGPDIMNLEAISERADTGPCVPEKETCNGFDDDCDGITDDVDPADLRTDLANCGACGQICAPANTVPECANGVCTIKECLPGAHDADKKVENGCECVLSNGGMEACDQLDNDCDGVTDEGFDVSSDINNCGACTRRCLFPFAMASCQSGMCIMGACLDGFYDRDMMSANGCEVACLKSNGGVEICDGQDNDCNGMLDDNVRPPTITCKTGGVCTGSAPICRGAMGFACNYPTDHQEVEDTALGCDGKDNDCDGRTDEAYDIGRACPVGMGACVGTGAWVCDSASPTGRRCNGSPRPPSPETCNGRDDDCDGKIDELDTMADRTTDDVLVYVPAPRNVMMFAYEATRYDATATDDGFDSTRRPCSMPGRLPWSNVTKEEAKAACELAGNGWRLCTTAEWFDTCNGMANTPFPYGTIYDGAKCNGYDYVKPAPYTTTIPTGGAGQCVSDLSGSGGDELYDMSGNVKEWVLTTISPAAYEMRGGAYNITSFGTPPAAPGLQCDSTTPAPTVPVRLPSVGFRCCRPGMLPP